MALVGGWACNALLLVGWAALLMAPLAHKWCWFLARTCAMLLACVWAVLAAIAFGPDIPDQLGRAAWPAAMMKSVSIGGLALVQFQTFNLFVASWQVEDGPRHAIPHGWLLPGLVATALSGPLGLLVHMGIRDVFKLRRPRAARQGGAE